MSVEPLFLPGCPVPIQPVPFRPLIKAALHRLWRAPGTLQLGIDPRRAIVLTGLDRLDAELIAQLDGGHDDAALARTAAAAGDPQRHVELLSTLRSAGALDDSSTWVAATAQPRLAPDLLALSLRDREPGAAAVIMADRQATELEVLGAGRVGASLAALLAAAGIGRVQVSDDGGVRAADLAPGGVREPMADNNRGEAANRVVAAMRHGPERQESARSVVVLAPTQPAIPPEWLRAVRHRPHLPVVIRETLAAIGPLVIPGRTACLRCVELARADRDPAWPALAAQLVGAGRGVEPCDITLAAAAAALAALHLLSWLDDDSAPAPLKGGVVELSLTDLRLRRQAVRGHPGCGCGADQPMAS